MSESESNPQTSLDQPEPFDYKKYRNFYELFGGFVAVVVLVGIGVLIFASDAPGYWQNIYITGVGAVLTVLFLDRQAEHRAVRQRKEELILQMGSPAQGFAVEAARLLRQKGWLWDGSLERAILARANLQGAILQGAHLQRANLVNANLQGAVLLKANLQGAYLKYANLQGAKLRTADLQGADLMYANLQGADLWEANLQGANLANANLESADLGGANLQGAYLGGVNLQSANLQDMVKMVLQGAKLGVAKLTEDTRLPDWTNWTPDTDMTRFTDPAHPNFWRSDDPESPAYRGDPTAPA